MTQPQRGICSICSDPLWVVGAEDKKISSTLCGHVFHEVCINRWVRVLGNDNCPKCREPVRRENPFHEIFIDKEEDPYYLDIVKENKSVREKFGSLGWNDFASNFQANILHKLRVSGCIGLLLKVECDLSSIIADHPQNIFLKLITSGDKIEPEVCKMVSDLYFQKLAQLKGTRTVTLDDVIQPLQNDLLLKLRLTSRGRTLKANQIPLTAKILSKLGQGKESFLLKDIIAIYVDEMVNGSVCLMNHLCCVTLLELVSELVYGELQVFNADAISRLEKMVELGLLEKSETGSFKFACDTVRNYFLGAIMMGAISKGVSRMDASKLLAEKWSLVSYFLIYFTEMSSSVLKSRKPIYPWNPNFVDRNLSDLLMILAVVKLKLINGSQEWLRKLLNHINKARNLREIEYPIKCWNGSFTKSFTLLHAAGISGSMQALLCIFNEFNLSDPKFKDVICFIAWKTMGKEEEEIKDRKEMISKYLITNKHARDLNILFPKHVRWEIHVDLIKFLVRNGLDPFQKNGDGDTLFHLVTSGMNAEQFHELVSWLSEFGFSKLFLEVGGVSKTTALHDATYRMDVKRETVELFLKAGVSLNKPDLTGRTVMYYAVKGGRGANFLSMLVEFGANFEMIDEEGNSGVHIAAQFSNLEALRYFGKMKMDVNRKNHAGESALLRTLRDRSKNMVEVIEVLVELGADVTFKMETEEEFSLMS